LPQQRDRIDARRSPGREPTREQHYCAEHKGSNAEAPGIEQAHPHDLTAGQPREPDGEYGANGQPGSGAPSTDA
jgi:hypothetical protein